MRKLRLLVVVCITVFLLPVRGFSQTSVANTVTIFETSGSSQANRAVSISRPFRPGDIPHFAQALVNGVAVLTQCDVKNRWPDGSLKFAIVSFIIPQLPASGSVTVSFTDQTSGNNTGYLTQADMLASSNFNGTIEMTGALTRTISARTMLAAGAYRVWLQGPIITAVIIEDRTTAQAYDTDFGDGSKALHPIFEAWFYPQGNKVDLGYTIENIWASNTLATSAHDLTYSLVLKSGNTSPTTEFTQASFSHIGRSRWHKRYWLGTDPPGIRIDHNTPYLVTTRAIPNYDTSVVPAESLIVTDYGKWTSAVKTLDGDNGSAARISFPAYATR